ncbi:MAG: T9SS type A sorting domain-containing protein [Bacteroidia bacterium]
MLSLLSFKSVNAQVISSHFFGQNAWMPDTIGKTVLNGKLHKHWSDIQNSNAAIIRFGGIAPDKDRPTDFQYIKMIDSIRAHGMEPVIQVPYNKGQYTAQEAADIVKYINVTKAKGIRYWIIGNEPNLGYGYTSSSQIAAYIKPFSSAMKSIDPSILIVGPETAWYDQNIINGLTTPNGPDDITGKDGAGHYYCDIISFHTYPFDGTQSRAQMLTKLTGTDGLQDNLAALNARIATCNAVHGRTGNYALKTAITEANVNWQNNANDNLYGTGVNSFIGAQFIAEMLGVGMKNGVDFINMWSVIEGNNTALNVGFLDATTGAKKPAYYHYKLMAENFKGNFVTTTGNQANVKLFSCNSGQFIQVLLLNQDQAQNFNFTVRLNTSAVSGSNPLKINVNANVNNEYNGTIQNQSTILLTFDQSGAIVKKTEYSLLNNAVANLAPTVTQYIATGVGSVADDGNGDIKNFQIRLFPNPTTGKFTVTMDKNNKFEKKLDVELFDMMGRQAYALTSTFSRQKEEIDLSGGTLADGAYIVRVREQEDHDNVRTEKMIIVH